MLNLVSTYRFCIVCLFMLVCLQPTNAKQKKYLLFHSVTDSVVIQKRIPHPRKFSDSTVLIAQSAQILARLHKKHFLLASIDSSVWNGNSCMLYIHTGPKYSTGSIRTAPDLANALQFAGLPVHKPLSISQYSSSRPKILEYYENNGFPFAQLQLDSVRIESGCLFGFLYCIPEQAWHFSKVQFDGDVDVATDFLYKQINISPGDIYRKKFIDAIPDRVNALEFAESRGEPIIQFRPNGEALLTVPLQRVRANSFDGIVGFAPNGSDNEKLIVTGDVSLELHNALKQGEDIGLHWEKLDEFSQNADADAYKRYILKTRVGAGAGIELEKLDTTYLNTRLYAMTDYYLKGNSNFGLIYQNWQNKLITDIAYDSISGTLQVLESKTHLWGVQYKYSKADNKLNPSRGAVVKLKFSNGRKTQYQTASVPDSVFAKYKNASIVYEASFSAEVFVPLTKPFVLMLGDQSSWLHNDQMFHNDLYRIGGTKSLRGFNEQSIYASAYTIGTVELRLLFDKKSNIYIFYDQAYYINKSINTNVTDTPKGFGLGLHVANKNSVFSISYAVGKQWDNPIIFSAGKIHFGYINRF